MYIKIPSLQVSFGTSEFTITFLGLKRVYSIVYHIKLNIFKDLVNLP